LTFSNNKSIVYNKIQEYCSQGCGRVIHVTLGKLIQHEGLEQKEFKCCYVKKQLGLFGTDNLLV